MKALVITLAIPSCTVFELQSNQYEQKRLLQRHGTLGMGLIAGKTGLAASADNIQPEYKMQFN